MGKSSPGGGGLTQEDRDLLMGQQQKNDAELARLQAEQAKQNGLISQQIELQRQQQLAASEAQRRQAQLASSQVRDQALATEQSRESALQTQNAQARLQDKTARLQTRQQQAQLLEAEKQAGIGADQRTGLISNMLKLSRGIR